MEEQVQKVLRELERFGRENDAAQTERSRKMLNLDRETAALVSMLARGSQARSALEIGTSNGYSTIWLAWSVRTSGGRVTTLDRRAEKQAMARENLARAGLADVVEFQVGDATELVRRLPGPYDFVFFDADRVTAPQQLQLLLPKLSARVFLLADNALSHPGEIAAYLAALQALPQFTHLVVPVGKGLSVAFRG